MIETTKEPIKLLSPKADVLDQARLRPHVMARDTLQRFLFSFSETEHKPSAEKSVQILGQTCRVLLNSKERNKSQAAHFAFLLKNIDDVSEVGID